MPSSPLLPYLIASVSAACALLTPLTAKAAVGPGEILIGEMNCAACHDAPGPIADRLFSRPSPRLDGAHAVRLNPQWIRAFLENPQAAQPGTLMPDLLGGLDSTARSEAAEALTHYLVGLGSPVPATVPAAPNEEAVRHGDTLYHSAGCVACHAPQEIPPGKTGDAEALGALEKLRQFSVPMGDLSKKYGVSELAAFLQDPLKSRPGGRMPSLKLTTEEARDIASYLLQHASSPPPQPNPANAFVVDAVKAVRGKELFASLNCAACHQVDAPGRKAKPMALLNGRQPTGCLGSRPKAGVPKFEITDRQRVVILSQLGSQDALIEPLTPEQQITRTMTVLNCYSCHARERRGGVDAMRRDYFTARTGADAKDEVKFPPSLRGVGSRLPPDRMRSVLVDGVSTRPDMITRMPLYGERNIHHLPALFSEADAPPAR